MDHTESSKDKLYLKRFCGEEIFTVLSATYSIDFDASFHRYNLHLNVKMDKLQGLDKDDPRFDVKPEWDLHFPLSDIEAHHLVEGLNLEIPYGYVDAVDNYYAIFSYYERIPSFKNSMTLLKVDADKWFIRIVGTTDDVEFYDGTRPLSSIHIEAQFTPLNRDFFDELLLP